jgi:uncharacterized protein with GYD domain
MAKFFVKFVYTSASWARMLSVTDDRESAAAALLEHLGGRLEALYWEVEHAAAFVICDLPDEVSAMAALTAATRTGAFKDVEVSNLLRQDQLHEVVDLARSAAGIYQPPGAAAVERDV